MWIARFVDWILCDVFKCHDWRLIEEYEPMVRMKFFTLEGTIEEKKVRTPFKKENTSGKWRCYRCGQVSIGSIANAHY